MEVNYNALVKTIVKKKIIQRHFSNMAQSAFIPAILLTSFLRNLNFSIHLDDTGRAVVIGSFVESFSSSMMSQRIILKQFSPLSSALLGNVNFFQLLHYIIC